MAHILIVDDEIQICNILQKFFKHHNHAVSLAHNGLQALQRIKKSQPDLIVSDIQMPEMDGITLFHHVQEQYPGIPFVAISGHIISPTECFDAFLFKPFTPDELLAIITNLLSISKSQH